MTTREKTVNFKVKTLDFGGNSTIYIQSMCNTVTKNVEETVNQILELEKLGCDISTFSDSSLIVILFCTNAIRINSSNLFM